MTGSHLQSHCQIQDLIPGPGMAIAEGFGNVIESDSLRLRMFALRLREKERWRKTIGGFNSSLGIWVCIQHLKEC